MAKHRLVNQRDMGDPTALYISDSIPPSASSGAFPLLITSPNQTNANEFSESGEIEELVLPMLEEDEIMDLRRVAFSKQHGCSEAEVKERFIKWGGNARNVLTAGAVSRWQKDLHDDVSTLSITQLEQALNGSTSLRGIAHKDNIHRLLKLVPCGGLPDNELKPSNPMYYHFHHAQLPSVHVEEIVGNALLTKHQAELYRFLHAAAADPAISSLTEVLYERCIVMPRLEWGGGSLPIQLLSAASVLMQPAILQTTTLDLPPQLPLWHYNDVSELTALWKANTRDGIFVPRSKQHSVVDLVLRLGGQPLLANATVSESHDVKVDNAGFQKVLSAVGLDEPTKEIPFLWILPAHAYDRFNSPGPLSTTAKAIHLVGKRVAQYKMLIVIPSTAEAHAAT